MVYGKESPPHWEWYLVHFFSFSVVEVAGGEIGFNSSLSFLGAFFILTIFGKSNELN